MCSNYNENTNYYIILHNQQLTKKNHKLDNYRVVIIHTESHD